MLVAFLTCLMGRIAKLFSLVLTFILCEISQGLSVVVVAHLYKPGNNFWTEVVVLIWAFGLGLHMLMNTITNVLLIYHAIKGVSI